MDLGLKGKKAIVTGGTRGIGRAIADLLADEGCDIALCARGEAGVEEAVAALAGKGVKAKGGAVDVADTKALRAWVAEAAERLGGLDVFVANVSALAQAMDEDSWRRSLDIDVMGTVAGVEAAIPFLEKSPAGAIVVIGTTGHKVPVVLHPEVEVTVTINVARSADEAERIARGENVLSRRDEEEPAEAVESAAETFFEKPEQAEAIEAEKEEGGEEAGAKA